MFLLFLVGVLLIAVPDGIEVVNLTAAILMTIAFVPYGIEMIRRGRASVSSGAPFALPATTPSM